MSATSPAVSIGLPVYNGEEFLEEALDSLLAQTFPDFELIVSDNASTDRTPAICRAYAAKDKRIRYVRSERNLGGAWNHNHVVALASGKYFKWGAHDDVCAPTYLERCVEVLEREDTISVCHCKTIFFDERGREWDAHTGEGGTASLRPSERFAYVVFAPLGEQISGVIRLSLLRSTPLLGAYVASDRVLLAHLALLGRFHEIPEPLFRKRDHPHASTREYPAETRIAWWDPARSGSITLPHWSRLAGYWSSVSLSPLSSSERLASYWHILKWLRGWPGGVGRWRFLAKDLQIASYQLASRLLGARRPSREDLPEPSPLARRPS